MIPILWREWRAFSHSLLTVVIHFVTPLFMLVFFATVLGRNLQSIAYGGTLTNYVSYFTPGLVGFMTFMTFQISMTFVRHDRMSGMLGIVVLSSGGLSSYIIGKLVAQVAINVVKAIVLVLLASLISSGPTPLLQSANLLIFLSAIVSGTAVWLSLGIALAFVLKRDDMRELLTMLISMPIAFASTMYYDVSRGPSWIVYLSKVNPLTYVCNIAREAYLSSDATVSNSDGIVMIVMLFLALAMVFVMGRTADLSAT